MVGAEIRMIMLVKVEAAAAAAGDAHPSGAAARGTRNAKKIS